MSRCIYHCISRCAQDMKSVSCSPEVWNDFFLGLLFFGFFTQFKVTCCRFFYNVFLKWIIVLTYLVYSIFDMTILYFLKQGRLSARRMILSLLFLIQVKTQMSDVIFLILHVVHLLCVVVFFQVFERKFLKQGNRAGDKRHFTSSEIFFFSNETKRLVKMDFYAVHLGFFFLFDPNNHDWSVFFLTPWSSFYMISHIIQKRQ